jgi:hypothetical protein
MTKAYISGWQPHDKPEEMKTDYSFTSNPESAHCWTSKEEALIECKIFDVASIKVEPAESGAFICKGFQAEERRPGEFVIFCEGPFVRQTAKGQSDSRSD